MNQHDHMLREALRSFIEAMDGSCDHPDTSSEREALRHAKRKAKQALAAEPAPLVRLTDDRIREIDEQTQGGLIEFANAIMDAMEKLNK